MKNKHLVYYCLAGLLVVFGVSAGLYAWSNLLPQPVPGGAVFEMIPAQEKVLLTQQHLKEFSEGGMESDNPLAQFEPLIPGLAWNPVFANRNPDKVAGRKGTRTEREAWAWFMRTYPGDEVPLEAHQNGYNLLQSQLQAQKQAGIAADNWQGIGPAPIENEWMGNFRMNATGRTTAILIDPSNANVVYVAGAQGGVWKTTNGGTSWTALTDDQPSLAIGSMTFDPNNSNTIYVGTGEPHNSADSYYGAGILRSTDGGANWTQLGASTFVGHGIADIVVSANNSNRIFAAASTWVIGSNPNTNTPGVYRSTDGGANWTLVASVCGQSSCTAPSSLVASPTNPDILYAGFDYYGVIVSTDGGDNWSNLVTPQFNVGRVEIEVSPANANRLYMGLSAEQQSGYFGLIYRSDDAGANWTQLNSLQHSYCGSQCSYNNILTAHPTNQNILFAGGQALYSNGVTGIDGTVFSTANGGISWSWNSGSNSNTTIHPDLHAIAFDPNNANTVWIGNDGGIYKSTDGGATWTNMNTNLGTLQFQSVALHPTNANIIFGGMQDNAKVKTINGGTNWEGLDAGDGGFTAIDPFSSNYWYGTRFSSSGSFMQFQRNDSTGSSPPNDWPIKANGINVNDRVRFYAPLAVDPNTAGMVYWGTHRLYRSADRGENWSAISGDLTKNLGGFSAISNFAIAPGNSNLILVGTTDGYVQRTTNGGGNWTNVTANPLPNRSVSDVAISASNNNIMYVVYNGYSGHTPGTPGHVFKSTNGGTSWTNISNTGQPNGLPDLPVLAIALDRDAPDTVYIGNDIGVYRSTDGGANWQPYNSNLPVVAVYDLALNPDTNVLVAATHGRSIWRINPSVPTAISSLSVSGLAAGDPGDNYTFNASVAPASATTPITFSWQASGQGNIVHTGVNNTTDSVTYNWAVTGTKYITVSADNGVGAPVVQHHNITIQQGSVKKLYLPLIIKNFDPGNPPPSATPSATSSGPTATNTPTPTATSPGSTATNTPTPTATSPGGLPNVINGDFESGSGVGWLESSSNGWTLVVDDTSSGGFPGGFSPRSGSYVAWLGGDNNETGIISQTFTIPSATPVYLHYYYQLHSNDICGYDYAYVLVDGVIVSQGDLCTTNNVLTWTLGTVDMASYGGQTVTVSFRADTDGSTISSFFVDDVSFQATSSKNGLNQALPSVGATPRPKPASNTLNDSGRRQ